MKAVPSIRRSTSDLPAGLEQLDENEDGYFTEEQQEQADYFINEAITDALNDLCPPYVYFGSHPGDGADFGFWPDIEGLRENLAEYKQWCRSKGEAFEHDGMHWLEDPNVFVHISDHGNVTVYAVDESGDPGQELWSCV
jgi:hypothetical protein